MSKKRLRNKTCYMCERSATTSEHVPPKCFFPKKRDLPNGIDYRKNLASRIPSCDLHNTDSSKTRDDEFLQITIVTAYGNNLVAQRDASKRMMPAIQQKRSLLSLITKNAQQTLVDGQETITFEVDAKRFERAILNVARAVYYREYGDKLTEDVKGLVTPPFLKVDEDKALQINSFLEMLNWVKQFFTDNEIPKKGAHPEVFYYQIYRDEKEIRTAFIRMVFYEGCEIDVAFDPSYK